METTPFPRSPKIQVGGLAHLGRLIDKIHLRHAGKIQDYNYLTVGFDKYLLDLLQLKGDELEQRVLEGGTDEEIAAWVHEHGKPLTDEDVRQWNEMVLHGGPQNEQAHQRFQAILADIAKARGVSVDQLPKISTWVDTIELDEGRL